MKYLNLTALRPLLLLLVVTALSSCVEKPGIWINGQISSGKRDDMHTLNDLALKCLMSSNTDSLKFVLSQDLIEDNSTLRKAELVSNALKANKFSLLDEYYVVRDTSHADSGTKIRSLVKGENAYGLSFTCPPGQTYIALFLPKTGDDRYLVCLEYYKYDYGWKLSNLDMGAYNMCGKTAPEFYELAKAEYAKNYLANAVNYMQLADDCMEPSQLWRYPQEKEMTKYYSGLLAEANAHYKFPMVITQVATHPRIFNITNTSINGKTYPTIYYLSGIKVSDTTGLKKENEDIKKAIGSLIPGIDKDKNALVYSAYNEMPVATKSVEHFDMIQKF